VAYCQARDPDDQHHDQAPYVAQGEMLCSEDRAYRTADQDQPDRKVDIRTTTFQEQVHPVRVLRWPTTGLAGFGIRLSEELSHGDLDALTTKLNGS
jgi:hypothetical protein